MRVLCIITLLLSILANSLASRGLISVYNHYGESAGGAYLWKYPATMRMTNGKSVYVYPAAMYSDRVSKYKYAVFKIQIGKRAVHVHIVDECADGDCHANMRTARRRGGMLYDVHESAMSALKIGEDLYSARVTYVGKIPRKNMGKVISSGGRKVYIPKKWH
jgi:hypothetical protein